MQQHSPSLEPLGAAIPWPAPAKLNLCLHIVGRRADGYHLLQSAIQFVDLCDELRFFKRPPGVIERIAGPADVPAEFDLVVRAGRLMASHAAGSLGAAIELHKRIPMQAGLGGGSSDAATVLVALNALWGLGFSIDKLADLGLKLGADVPMFVHGSAAWMEGIGEKLTVVEFEKPVYVIVKPPVSVSTADIFNAPELTRNTPITTIRAFREQGGWNDCTATVRARYPQIGELLDWLGQYGKSRLTGTGSCVFVVVRDRSEAERILAKLPTRWTGFVAQGLNRSPLLARLEKERA